MFLIVDKKAGNIYGSLNCNGPSILKIPFFKNTYQLFSAVTML